jgi:hypothetical protein
MTLEQCLEAGFDNTRREESDDNGTYLAVRCSQCEAAVINGVPCHERGCPNAAKAKRLAAEEEYAEACGYNENEGE